MSYSVWIRYGRSDVGEQVWSAGVGLMERDQV